MTRDEYIAGVKRTQEYIAAGDVYQLVLASRFSGQHELDPFQAYRALRLINPSPYMYYCALGDITVVGSSPEALVKLNAGNAQLRPIAGTRSRSDDTAVDVAREAELRADPKENAEHVMLVDLARNDLGRVAAAGSVHVDPFRHIERYSHVMHIVSGVKGRLAAGKDAFDLFAATFPAGTLVGAPKVRAMQIIDELEPVGRGLYGGTVGYFGARGDMDQAITIRTLVFHGDEYSFQAGAGLVADSVPEAEHDEVLAKAVPWCAPWRWPRRACEPASAADRQTMTPLLTTWYRPSWCWAPASKFIAMTKYPLQQRWTWHPRICVYPPAPVPLMTPASRWT